MKKNFFKALLYSALVLVGSTLVSCSDDDTDEPGKGNAEMATITIAPDVINLGLEETATETITITANGAWTATIPAGNADITITPAAGTGNATAVVSVGAATVARNVAIVFMTQKATKIPGVPQAITTSATATLKITQSNAAPVEEDAVIYTEHGGASVAKGDDNYWPYVDKYTGWAPEGGNGVDQSGVKYTGSGATVRNSGKAWKPGDDATHATDAPYAYLQAGTGKYFQINNVNLKEDTNYTLTFTAHDQYASLKASPYTPGTVAPSNDNVKLQVSTDGTSWGVVKFEAAADGSNGWYYCTAPFTLSASASQLFIKFADFVADTTTALPDASTYQYQAALRLDDFILAVGGNGPIVEVGTDPTPTPTPGENTTIDQITAVATGLTTEGWVAAATSQSFILMDNTGWILTFLGSGATVPAVGANVKVTGDVSLYSGALQYNKPTVETLSGTTTVTHPAVQVLDGAAFDTICSGAAHAYVQYVGNLVHSGNYWNVESIEGTTKIGAISYPNDTLTATLNDLVGQSVVVTGYASGTTGSGARLTTIATEVKSNGVATPNPTITCGNISVGADGVTNATATITLKDLDGVAVSARADGTVVTAASVSGTTLTYSVAANTGAAREGSIVLSATGAKDVTVVVKQSGVQTGDSKTLLFDADAIGAADLPENGYGTQNVADMSTYLTKTIDGIEFKICKMCRALSSGDFAGYLQCQGNTQEAKTSRLGNSTSMGKIKKITIVTMNKSTYQPNFNLALGAAQQVGTTIPTGMIAATEFTTTSTEVKTGFNEYTSVYEPTTDAAFFAIYKNTSGALYIKSITIEY